MPARDPAQQLARELATLRREVNSLSRGSQAAHRSLEVDGESIPLPQVVEEGREANERATIALTTANGKNKVVYSDDAPTGAGVAAGDVWFRRGLDGAIISTYEWTGTAWEAREFDDAVLRSLTVGKLVTGEISAGQRIIAGPAAGTHAEMSDTGFRVYREDPADGVPNEVARLGTSTNDYFAIVGADGQLVASVDDTGRGNFASLNVTGAVTVEGRPLADVVTDYSPTAVGYFEDYPPAVTIGHFGPIRDRVGIAEVNAFLDPGRRYRLTYKTTWFATNGPGESRIQFTYAGPTSPGSDTAANPLVSSPVIDQWLCPTVTPGNWASAHGSTTFVPTTAGRHRFLCSIERGAGPSDTNIYVVSNLRTILAIEDTGPARPTAGILTQGGGQFHMGPPPPPPPPPTQQYYVDLAPVGRRTWRGNGTLRTDTSEVVQGWDPSGYNGDGRGTFWFWLPDITGVVDRVDLYLYSTHWYYNSGGTAIINISDARGETHNPWRFRGDLYVGGYPRPGGKTITLPSDWYSQFEGTGNANFDSRASTIVLGPGYGTNLAYYGKFSDCRLRIWYTQ